MLIRCIFLFAIALGTTAVSALAPPNSQISEEEANEIRVKTEKSVTDALEAMRIHKSVFPEQEAKFY